MMDDLITLFLVPVLGGAAISMVLCMVCGRRKRPSFWLAPLSALGTGIGIFIGFSGDAIFTRHFWTEDGSSIPPGSFFLLADTCIFGIIGLFPSLGVIAIYRRLRK